MENKKTIISLGILLFSLSFTFCLYAGESYYYDLSDDIENLKNFTCNITGENYDLEGLNFSVNDTGYIIDSQTNFQPDNLTITCLLNGYKIVQTGGSSSTSVSQTKLKIGYEDNLRENHKIKFSLGTHSHTFTLKKIYNNYAEFSMKSEEQIFNLSIEECKIIELEEPIKVCLLSLDKWDADISIKSVNITEEIPNKINNVPSSASGSISVNIENKDIPVEEKNIYLRKIILIIIILGILIGLFFKFRKKKKVDNDNN